MDNLMVSQIEQGLHTAFIDGSVVSNHYYKPQFVYNNYKEGQKVLSAIEEELLNCESFFISVAFITKGGITPLLGILKELEKKGICGRILTTDYLTFSQPEALDKIASLSNIALRMYHSKTENDGFHTKGYIFENKGIYKIIVGSSNMTAKALTVNSEWNTKLISTEDGEFSHDLLSEFERLWNSPNSEAYDEFIQAYRIKYHLIKKQREITKSTAIPTIEQYQLQPNKMQVEFIQHLQGLIENGASRALLISATGTGKTYASAFALREYNPQKVLFLVHREQIAKQAMESYKMVFGDKKSMGLLSGNSKNYKEDFLFSTMQMMAREDTLSHFKRDEFTFIVIDEVHRVGAESYQRIINYFEPEFLLGMTASPERTDNYDIFALFHHNIAYEIRLQQALEEELLCPFHYFGITDLEIDGHIFDDTSGIRNFANLVCDDRVNYIIEQAQYYGYSGNRVKGLVFCSRKDEAEELSKKFNQRGYRTTVLTGSDSQNRREECIELLTNDEKEDHLDYIFTIDIFNEGVDIPEINQVIMLRPTESPIVFVQQLGRGLRKANDKEYVVVLDFIGNYMNNFMIPIALSGDRTYNKDNIRKYVREGSRIIPGSSTIHFDEVSKKRIFESIDCSKTTKKFLAEKYQILKNRLGRIPSILDFYEFGEIDPMLLIHYAKAYHRFVQMVDQEYKNSFSPDEEALLEFVSSLLVNGKRPHELLMLQMLMQKDSFSREEFQLKLQRLGDDFREEDYQSAVNVLNKQFINTQAEKKKYGSFEILDQKRTDQVIVRAKLYYEQLKRNNFKNELSQLITYGFRKFKDEFLVHDEDHLVLYQKYSRKDVCRILNWEQDNSSTMYGYRIKYGTCPIFVTYEKKDDISNSTKYEDQFIDPQVFSWMTRSKVSLHSPEAQQLIHHEDEGLRIYLFIKKSDGEGSDFYYMGRVTPVWWRETVIENDKGKQLPIMNFHLQLQHSVRSDIYEYFTK